MKKSTAILLSLLLLIENSYQIIRDESFVQFCNNVDGTPTQTITGDICTVVWKFPAADDEDAEYYCKTWGAYPLQHFTRENGQPKCIYENVYECDPAYTLINGACYRMLTPSQLYSLDNAQALCSEQTIPDHTVGLFKLNGPDQLRFIRAYFAGLRGFWIHKDKTYTNHAVLYGLAQFYKIGPGDVTKIRKHGKAQALCYYEAKETPLSFRYKAKMLKDYYSPTVSSGFMTIWKTTNHYSYMKVNEAQSHSSGKIQPMTIQEICANSMRAIVGISDVSDWDATIVNVAQLTDDFKKSFNQAYAPYFNCYWDNGWRDDNNYWHRSMAHRVYRRPPEYKHSSCDTCPAIDSKYKGSFPSRTSYDFKATFLFFPNKADGYDLLQRVVAIDAPVLCQMTFKDRNRKKKCSDGWTSYKRYTGRYVCHKYFQNQKTYDEAKKQCNQLKGQVSTFTDQDEYNILLGMGEGWVGLMKHKYCTKMGTGRCAPNSIVYWEESAFGDGSAKVMDVVARNWWGNEPNHDRNDDWCIELKKETSNWGLNDIRCGLTNHYYCVRDADMD